MDASIKARVVTPLTVARGFEDIRTGRDIAQSATSSSFTNFFAWLFDTIFGTSMISDEVALVGALHDAQSEMMLSVLRTPTFGKDTRIEDGEGVRTVNLGVGGKTLKIQEKISFQGGLPVIKLMIAEDSEGGPVTTSPMKFESFSQLKRACLIRVLALQKQMSVPEALSGFDLVAVDLTGVDFSNAVIDQNMIPAIVQAGGNGLDTARVIASSSPK